MVNDRTFPAITSTSQHGIADFILPYSDVMPLDEDDLWGLTDYELYLARNEIYTRHGREFINEDLSAYFDGKTWYMPFIAPEDFSDAMLSQVERDDLQVILAEEEDRGPPYL